MKRLILWTFVLCMWLGSRNCFAQEKRNKGQIESLKIAFITERLQLTPEEAKTFWPVYNKMETETKELRKKHKMSEEDGVPEDMSEAEAEKKLNEMFSFKEAQLNLSKKYQSELKKVIPSRKVLLLYRAEDDFKRELLRRMRERRGNGQGPRPNR